jgi:hypothetical protein
MITPVLKLETSSIHGGLDLRRDGEPVSIEDALASGFTVTDADANILLTLAIRFLETRDANHN